jgi:hypothetical protein
LADVEAVGTGMVVVVEMLLQRKCMARKAASDPHNVIL